MKHNEQEMILLREEINQMWKLVISQLEKAKQAFLTKDVGLALEVITLEKRVNAFELKIDSNCENYIALYNPVAIDLRLVLSIMKISITLERIGDYAVGIARYIADKDCNYNNSDLIESLELERMFNILQTMILESYISLSTETTANAGKILAKDQEVNEIYRNALLVLTNHIQNNPEFAHCGLKLSSLIRKMERIGDHCSNIVEEIVFYIEAKVLKHKGKTN
ncbi:MAG: phosphate signaling complex protein PhoU [Crocinitomicaceae bacterium]|nr:phosphate signaling complex protein PhoU [Crocinitomicaceae bacterium]